MIQNVICNFIYGPFKGGKFLSVEIRNCNEDCVDDSIDRFLLFLSICEMGCRDLCVAFEFRWRVVSWLDEMRPIRIFEQTR